MLRSSIFCFPPVLLKCATEAEWVYDTLESSYFTLKYSVLPNMRASQEVKVYISLET